ncbi:MAG: DEAD/DEAH box helicase [Flavobacteriaceae bacterium]
MKDFIELGLSQGVSKSLGEMGVKTPTDVQKEIIPLLLDKEVDLLAMAQTGSGKTLAYVTPIIDKIKANEGIQALVLVPTRELAQQVKKVFFKSTKHIDKRLFVEAVYGGQKIHDQEDRLKKPTQILVATPGRLLELLERNSLDIRNLKYLVLDEADEMIQMGFRPDLNRLIRYMSDQKHVWLFSATLPDELRAVIKKYLRPGYESFKADAKIRLNPNINHEFKELAPGNKMDYIIDQIDGMNGEQGIIFVRTKANAQKLAEELSEDGIAAKALEGNMGQRDRDKVMRGFKNGATQILVATDVAARGLDISDLNYIIHHQLPDQTVFYPHRSGRTARAGKKGLSLALVSPRENHLLNEIEKTFQIKFKQR